MRKYVRIISAGIFLLFLFIMPTMATVDLTPKMSYIQDENLYACFTTENWQEMSGALASLQSLSTSHERGKLLPYRGDENPIWFILLLDCSGSMTDEYQSEVSSFVKGLEDAFSSDICPARYSLVTFGEGVQTVIGDPVGYDSIRDSMNNIPYQDKKTSLYDGLQQAVYLAKVCNRKPNEFVEVILITDGNTVATDYRTANRDGYADDLKSSETIIHCLILDENASPPYIKFINGITMTDSSNKAVKKLKKWHQELLYLNLSGIEVQEWETEKNVLLYIENGQIQDTFLLNSVSVLSTYSEQSVFENSPSETDGIDVQESDTPEVSDSIEDQETLQSVDEFSIDEEKGKNEKFYSSLIIIILVFIALILIGFFLYWNCKKRKPNILPESVPAYGRKEISMIIDVMDGNYLSERKLVLVDELIVGKNPSCDIRFRDGKMENESSRIFLKNGFPYIEDMDSDCGTFINGKRITTEIRLYSGDIVSYPMSSFRLLF